MSDGWLDQVRERGVLAVGKALGLQETRRGSLAPCPSCGRETRSSHDRRGPIGVRRDNEGWVCHRCDARGDPVTLAAWVLAGTAQPVDWKRIWVECADAGICNGPEPRHGSTTPRKRPRMFRSPRIVSAPYVPRYPGNAEAHRFWEQCRPVIEDADVASWLAGRGFAPEVITRLDLVRALPTRSDSLPDWAQMGRNSWAQSSHRVIARFWNAQGDLATVHARATRSDAKPKGLSPRGFDIQGTVLANRSGVELLRSGTTDRRVLIAEGVPDWLVWSCWAEQAGSKAPAVLGVISGSWTDDLAARIPDQTRVLIRTHDDKAGHKYADKIAASLLRRCIVLRRVAKAEGERISHSHG